MICPLLQIEGKSFMYTEIKFSTITTTNNKN